VFSEEPAEAAARARRTRRHHLQTNGGGASTTRLHLEAFVAAELTLRDHLAEQLASRHRAGQRMIDNI